MNIFRLHPNAFGLSITDDKISAIQLKKEKSAFSLVGFLDIDLTKGIIEDGEIKNKEKLAEAIKNTLSKKTNGGINTRNTIFSLPEFKTFIQIVDVPAGLNREELEEAVKWEAESNIPIPINEVYLDWKVFSDSVKENTQKIFLAAAPKKMVDDYAEVLELAGLRAVAAEIESISLARTVSIERLSKDNAALIIALDKSKTVFIVIQKDIIRFTSSISQSNSDVIIEEAKRSLDFAREHIVKNGSIDLILIGEKAMAKSLSCFLSDGLNEKVFISDSWERIKKNKRHEKDMLPQSSFTALGLAIRAANLNT